MNAMVISQDTLDQQLSQCKDGETGDFTIKGGTLTMVPGVGAVVAGDNITKSGYDEGESTEPNEGETAPMPTKPMSASAMAVVGRKGAVGARKMAY
jgi:hypothetical protein